MLPAAVVLVVLVGLLGAAQHGREAVAPRATPQAAMSRVDGDVDQATCRLLGRVWGDGGCRRDRCLRAVDTVRPAANAEVCLRGGPGGAQYGNPVPEATCRALHRRFLPEVNLCAAVADRSRPLVRRAAPCVAPRTTYVVHSEREGDWDECVAPQVANRLERLALRSGTPVGAYIALRSRNLCALRPGFEFRAGQCRATPAGGAARAAVGATPQGVLLLGDSVAWRAADELGALRPAWRVDAVPGRLVQALPGRLARQLRTGGVPSTLVVALGTNPGHHWVLDDYLDAVAVLPESTRIVWVLPHRETQQTATNTAYAIAEVSRVQRAMAGAAAARPGSCLAEWGDEVARSPELLVDGVHPTREGEQVWAQLVTRAVDSCA
ncbi:hypothetical protein [Nocardioides nanhaiensis]|uniref:SGNH hydrolase-type esterase domain-containing protein n=1 Tax=Nocardioides nanhaiensis TaxID=1476871 RepID=A0ABP8X032_9ACTN